MPTPRVPLRAAVFDAYGTLFDVTSAAADAKDALGAHWQPLADLWRTKQLQYSWLRGLAGRHADFRQVTGDALDFALESLGVGDGALRARLMTLYETLAAYPDARPALEALRRSGLPCAILSNGSPPMLAAATRSAGLTGLLDAILSVEEVGVYKPHPSVYRLAVDRLGLAPEEILFVSSNGWDAWGAKASGLTVAWCNRSGQPPERLRPAPDFTIRSLAELPAIAGVGG
ncbi:haloacid dehalogenase type II [Anaeromyxobacter oryzae]|uniref:Haloacid dehalogenase n=1 Tax=Anaeromyxobacter oryzae TaxID=2918170 RepID=A0ABM7WTF3_9BACT|nr:haloacid dehalogenase type II [Anaeromyxobacter oryzae]BDG02761.1 haloacid dehalogenase [Anaeromyxobacter oryzae]